MDGVLADFGYTPNALDDNGNLRETFREKNGKSIGGLPHYLGTDPAIATEDAQRLVKECGAKWCRDPEECPENLFAVSFSKDVIWFRDSQFGHHLMLALVCALIAKDETESTP